MRSRRNSLVQSIASHGGNSENHTVPNVLDDTYLFNKLQKLSTVMDGQSREYATCKNTEDSIAKVSTTKYSYYTDYLDQLDANIGNYKVVIDKTKKVNDQLDIIINRFQSISMDSSQFIDDTKELYDNYHMLNELNDQIPNYLFYFESLDSAIRRLNHASSPNVVKRDSFKKLLANIDTSLIFLEDHPDFMESEGYRIRFKQCLIRANELISNYLSNSLKTLYSEIMEKNIDVTAATRDALLYNKFASMAEIFHEQIGELINRTLNPKLKRYHGELNAILNDCFNNYFQIRTKLLSPVIWFQLDETLIKDKQSNLIKFIQDSKSYFQQLCTKEYKLFIKFFPENELCKKKVNIWFLRMSEPLYTMTRSKVSKEEDIDSLCDCILFFAPFYEFEEGSEEYVKQFNEVQLDKVFEPVVQKLQEQIMHASKTFSTADIIKYTFRKDDLMISNRKSNKALNDKRQFVKVYIENFKNRVNSQGVINEFENKVEFYYPPLVKSLALLYRVYEVISSGLFDELTHYLIHECIQSLKKAFQEISSQHRDTIDIKLSYLRNLLLLRDELQNFNIQYPVSESNSSINFSGVREFISSIRRSNNSLFAFAKGFVPSSSVGGNTASSGKDNTSDVRVELIQELRSIIKDFTESASNEIISDSLNISDENIIEQNKKIKQDIEKNLPSLSEQVFNSIHDREIANNLIEAIEEHIILLYKEYYAKVVCLPNISTAEVDLLLSPDALGQYFSSFIEGLI